MLLWNLLNLLRGILIFYMKTKHGFGPNVFCLSINFINVHIISSLHCFNENSSINTSGGRGQVEVLNLIIALVNLYQQPFSIFYDDKKIMEIDL